MSTQSQLDAMSDLCIAAGASVMKHGSEDLHAAMRILLMILGREIAEQVSAPIHIANKRLSITKRVQ